MWGGVGFAAMKRCKRKRGEKDMGRRVRVRVRLEKKS